MPTSKTRNYKPIIWILTVTINLLVAVLFFLPQKETFAAYDFSFLAGLNAVFNFGTFLFLVLALLAIKRKSLYWHKRFIFIAFSLTSLFLMSYVLYHYTTPSTHYAGEGMLRYVYYVILITHVLFAAIIVPLALFSMGYGLNMQVDQHRKIVKWSMPIWLYVSLTGVIVYLMLLPYY